MELRKSATSDPIAVSRARLLLAYLSGMSRRAQGSINPSGSLHSGRSLRFFLRRLAVANLCVCRTATRDCTASYYTPVALSLARDAHGYVATTRTQFAGFDMEIAASKWVSRRARVRDGL